MKFLQVYFSLCFALTLAACERPEIERVGSLRTDSIVVRLDSVYPFKKYVVIGSISEGENFSTVGHCWSVIPQAHPWHGLPQNPPQQDSFTTSTNIGEPGIFESTLPNLSADEYYYVRSWGLENGKYRFGNEISFLGLGGRRTTETLEGEKTSNDSCLLKGIYRPDESMVEEEYGFCWSNQEGASTSHCQAYTGSKKYPYRLMVAAPPGQDLYFRSYAVDQYGTRIYGEEKKVRGASTQVSTYSIYNPNPDLGTYLQATGVVSGVDESYEYGFCWAGENEIPTLENNFKVLGASNSDIHYTMAFDSLVTPESSYSYRAFVRLTQGPEAVLYGDLETFTARYYVVSQGTIPNNGPWHGIVNIRGEYYRSTPGSIIRFAPLSGTVLEEIPFPGPESDDPLLMAANSNGIFAVSNPDNMNLPDRLMYYHLLDGQWYGVDTSFAGKRIHFAVADHLSLYIGAQNDSSIWILKEVYHLKNGEWTRLPDYPGTPWRPSVQYLSGGDLHTGLNGNGVDYWTYSGSGWTSPGYGHARQARASIYHNGWLYYTASNQLWALKFNGTTPTTYSILRFPPQGIGLNPASFVYNGRLFLAVGDDDIELWEIVL